MAIFELPFHNEILEKRNWEYFYNLKTYKFNLFLNFFLFRLENLCYITLTNASLRPSSLGSS